MNNSHLHLLDLKVLSEGLESGSWTSVEIIDSLFAHIKKLNPTLKAYCVLFSEAARELAKARDDERAKGIILGPFHGLPISVKENFQLKDQAVTQGLHSQIESRYEYDADMIAWLKSLGAIIIGRTNVPQALVAMDSSNPVYGTTQNPWSARHVAGGSSGGEASAVASFMSPLGLGTDLGGSLRFPAAFCGVLGYKPTTNLLPNYGFHGASRGQTNIAAQAGFVSRSAQDLEWVMDKLLSVPPDSSKINNAPFSISLLKKKIKPLSELKIGFFLDDGFITPADSQKRAVLEVVEWLRSEGAELIEMPPVDTHEYLEIYLRSLSANGLKSLRRYVLDSPIDPSLRDIWNYGKVPVFFKKFLGVFFSSIGKKRISFAMKNTLPTDISGLWELESRRRELVKKELVKWNEKKIDLMLSPAAATSAVLRGLEKETSLMFSYYGKANLYGFPAAVIPISRVRSDETHYPFKADAIDKKIAQSVKESEGLPVGVQLVGLPWGDFNLLNTLIQIQDYFTLTENYPDLKNNLENNWE